MNALPNWSRMPPGWISCKKLRLLTWQEHGAAGTAALVLLMPIAHHMALTPTPECDVGRARLSYEQLIGITGISRAVIARAIPVLTDVLQVLKVESSGRGSKSQFAFTEVPDKQFRKLPARSIYTPDGKKLWFADGLTLRGMAELHAMKLFYLYAYLRNGDTNYATVSYEKITDYTAVSESKIRSANSHLLNWNLIKIDQILAPGSAHRHNAYRIVGVDPKIHAGTQNLESSEVEKLLL